MGRALRLPALARGAGLEVRGELGGRHAAPGWFPYLGLQVALVIPLGVGPWDVDRNDSALAIATPGFSSCPALPDSLHRLVRNPPAAAALLTVQLPGQQEAVGVLVRYRESLCRFRETHHFAGCTLFPHEILSMTVRAKVWRAKERVNTF